MRDFAKEFYKSNTWKECRSSFVSYKRGLCEKCLEKGIYSAGVIVHHKVHITPNNINDPNVTLNFDNLELLCRNCHAEAHSRQKRYKFDEYGRCLTAPYSAYTP